MMRPPLAIATVLAVSLVLPAQAACPQERAVYTEVDGTAQIEFSAEPAGFVVTNSFRLLLADELVLDGIVMWNQGVSRPSGLIMHQCPIGDVTGEELDACTHWEGVIYTVAEDGSIGMIGQDDAAAALLLPDISRQLHYSELNADGRTLLGFDVFALSGCQQ